MGRRAPPGVHRHLPRVRVTRRAARHLARPTRRPRRRVTEIPQLRYATDPPPPTSSKGRAGVFGAHGRQDQVTSLRPNGGVAPSAAERTVRTGTRADPRPVVTSEGGQPMADSPLRGRGRPRGPRRWITGQRPGTVCVCWTLGPGSCSAHTAIEVSADRTSSLLVKRRRHWSAPEVPALVTGRQRVDNQDAGWAVPPT